MPIPSACIPLAGTPALPDPPNWLGGSGSNPKLDDPRWVGALRHSQGDGTGELAAFRALHHKVRVGEFDFQTFLDLSWLVRFGPANIAQVDSLYVGFSPDGQKAVVVKIKIDTATVIEDAVAFIDNTGKSHPVFDVTVRYRDTATRAWTKLSPTPSWLNPRLWIQQSLDNSPEVPQTPANQAVWAIQLVTPLDTLADVQPPNGPISIGNTFKMWYAMFVRLPNGSILQHTWPPGTDYIANDSDLTAIVYPDPTIMPWGDVSVGTVGHQPACTAGISLSVDNVGTTNPVSSNINVDANNTFFADPTNHTGTDIAAHNPQSTDPGPILARFRIANWGSVFSNSPQWTDIPGLEAVPNQIAIPAIPLTNPGGPPAGGGHFISKDFQPDPHDKDKFLQHPHQCILVQLSSTHDVQFVNDSVSKNMDFVSTKPQPQPPQREPVHAAFVFQREAEINLLGLPPIAPDGRDVFIFFEKFNMPLVVNRRRAGVGDVGLSAVGDVVAEPPPPTIGKALLTQPAARHHVFFDTGKTTTIDGVSYPILLVLSSFGYIIQHEGPVFGWDQRLEGAELIAPNFYKIAKAPNDKPVIVSTTIEVLVQPRGARSSGFMVQSTFGTKGDFELVVPNAEGGLAYCTRDNDNTPSLPWQGPIVFGKEVGHVDAVSLIQSNFGSGNLEVVARVGDRLVHFWRDSGPSFTWHGPTTIEQGISGNPALIQSRFGKRGNFELVVLLASGGIAHYWRSNDDPALPWLPTTVFGTELGNVDAVALIQSNFGQPRPGNLEVVARTGDDLIHFWRDSGPDLKWRNNGTFFSGATGIPGFIQGRFGNKGHFEVVTPVSKGGMVHLQRNNDTTVPTQWNVVAAFGSGNVTAVSLLQSNFTVSHDQKNPGPGDFEVAARIDGRTAHYWRHDLPPFTWEGPTAYACS